MRQFQCQIFIAATGSQRKLLEQEFPTLTYLDPPSYDIDYPKQDANLVFGLLLQLPRLFRVAKEERKWVARMVDIYQIDLVISDNRYGFRHNNVFSLFVGHQLAPISGFGHFIDNIINIIHVSVLNQFNQCWVPDEEQGGLAGKLSHPAHVPRSLRYIGPVSRFSQLTERIEKKGSLLIMVSGPEPRRSIFEALLLEQLKGYKGAYILVRGLPAETDNNIPNSYNHVPAQELKHLIAEASHIICRAGYTSIMDLAAMEKTAVLVPTPGQTEQEYLADYLCGKKYFLSVSEENFQLSEQVQRLQRFIPSYPQLNFNAYTKAIDELMITIKQKG